MTETKQTFICIMCLKKFDEIDGYKKQGLVSSCPFCHSIHIQPSDMILDMFHRRWLIFSISQVSLTISGRRFKSGTKVFLMDRFKQEIQQCKQEIKEHGIHPEYFYWRKLESVFCLVRKTKNTIISDRYMKRKRGIIYIGRKKEMVRNIEVDINE